MNRSLKLSLFLELGCKPMKDVMLHHPDWDIHCGNTPMEILEKSKIVKEGIKYEKELMSYTVLCRLCYQDAMAIEAIPERLTTDEISNDRADMIDGYRESFPECFQ